MANTERRSADQKHRQSSGEEDDDLDVPVEPIIAKTLSDRTTKIVVMLVLIMLFCLEFFKMETYTDDLLVHENGLKMVCNIFDQGSDNAY